MSTTIVVGGQYGSEGKGKVVALLAFQAEQPWLVRCGGPNSGHSVRVGDKDIVLRQVPCSTDPLRGMFCVAAGCIVDEALLCAELDLLGIEPERIIVDPRAVIVTDDDRNHERATLGQIASTLSGTGSALARRMSRQSNVRLASDSRVLRTRCRVESVAPLLHCAIDDDCDVIIEGTQGFGLSLLHGPDYPFVTSRDTTAAAFTMEAGLSPRQIDNIVLVIRTFPIPVGGPSGPFANEISWEDIKEISGAPSTVPEFTSVTRRLRRVAHFDIAAVKKASRYNCPTGLAIMGLDRLDFEVFGATRSADLTSKARNFVEFVETSTGVPAQILGTGFSTFDAILDLPNGNESRFTVDTRSARTLAHA